MKKSFVFTLVLIYGLNLFSQINKGGILISIDGNYLKSNTNSGVLSNQYSVQGKYLELNASAGIFVSDNFIVGIGLEYNLQKETRDYTTYLVNYLQDAELQVNSHILSPEIFFGYYFPITSRLFINTNLSAAYGTIRTDLHYMSIDMAIDTSGQYQSSIGSIGRIVRESKSSREYDYFVSRLCPEILYSFTDKWIGFISLGGIEYSITQWNMKSSTWNINFNPNYWRVGVKFKIN